LKILVAGRAAKDRQGGAAWAVLQYVLGLERLGHEVRLVEFVPEPSDEVRAYFDVLVRDFALRGELLTEPRGFAGFDLVINISGTLAPDLIESIPVRVYLDQDPAFSQLWQETGVDMRFAGHTHHATVGLAMGLPGCDIPTHGFEWIHTLPPIVLARWPPAEAEGQALTTVANFRSYGSIERNGTFYGQKAHALRELMRLPARTGERFVLALAVHPDERRDLDALAANGWELVDPTSAAGTPAAYAGFILSSLAEIGIAKHGYAISGCGWFSDRSACYLASGRPVIAQETGFSAHLPSAEGLLAFADEDGAVAAIEAVRANYERHAKAARRIAEECFDSDRVLARLLKAVTA
jgi:hypothetical protein